MGAGRLPWRPETRLAISCAARAAGLSPRLPAQLPPPAPALLGRAPLPRPALLRPGAPGATMESGEATAIVHVSRPGPGGAKGDVEAAQSAPAAPPPPPAVAPGPELRYVDLFRCGPGRVGR